MYTVREINDEYNFIGAIQKDGQNFGVIWTVVDMYNITTAVNPINGGTVTCSPNPVPRGTNSICTASANSGYVFSDWSGDCSGTTCTLSNVTSAKSVTANFALKTYNIATPVDPAGAGTVSCTLNPVPHGGESTCTANAAAGYTFTSWIGNCSIAVGNICTLSNVTSDQTLTARFTLTGPALSINNVTKKEGNKGTTNFTFTVTLNSASTQKVTVQYKTADGTAKAGSDYTATSGTLTFKAGQTSKTVTVKVIGDKAPEPDEMFFVNLNNVSSGVTILDGEGVGTITNDDR